MKKTLNITNGKYFNDYVSKHLDGMFVSFNEALIEGTLTYPLFDQKFINNRVKTHYLVVNEKNIEEYEKQMSFFINNKEEINDYQRIVLWFGEDAFCLINLLGLLTYLEQLNYQGEIFFNVIDEENYNLNQTLFELELGNFTNSYSSLINGNVFTTTKNDLIDKGIKMYIELLSKDNKIIDYIIQNDNKIDKNTMIIDLLDISKEYGLSDVYLSKLIDKFHKE